MNIKSLLLSRYSVASNPLMAERRVELLAVVLGLLFLLLLLYGFIRLQFLSEPAPIIPSSESLEVTEMVSVTAADAEQALEIVSRPLFWPSRRPLPGSDEAGDIALEEAAQAGELAKIKVLGIFGGGQSAGVIALVKDKKRRILLNEEAIGWTLQSVEPDRAVFISNGKTQEVQLKMAAVSDNNEPKTKKLNNGVSK
ncbi:MAG: hypothetical protein V7709_07830 [Halioglobus sp.]